MLKKDQNSGIKPPIPPENKIIISEIFIRVILPYLSTKNAPKIVPIVIPVKEKTPIMVNYPLVNSQESSITTMISDRPVT